MINLIVGPPGGGKSYEAVVYHILPALKRGRKVITNLPLDLARLSVLDESFLDLVEIRTTTNAEKPETDWEKAENLYKKFGIAAKREYFVNRPFAHPEDYGDPWRSESDGSGPLYVIDECHLALPRGATKIAVEEWYSLHRHESADVLLITQSYGKVSKSIIDLVQVCYRVKKGTAFGSASQYIRKVQDGVRGDVVNTTVRKYEKRYFGLYKSHTRGGGAELAAEDIIPIWKRWPFIGAALMFAISAAIFFVGGSPNLLKPKLANAKPIEQTVVYHDAVPAAHQPVPSVPVVQEDPEPENVEPKGHPFNGRTLHIVGQMVKRGKTIYEFAVAQNAQRVASISGDDLEQLGYTIKAGVPCAAQITYDKWTSWVICDAPQLSVGMIAQGQGANAEPSQKNSEPKPQSKG